MKITGQCHCGAIRYEADVDPAKVNACHCTDCQRFSGAPYRVSVRAPKESFRLLSGTPKIYVKTAESGNKRAQAFCADCGSALYAASVPEPDAYMLRVGGIDQRADLPPQRQIWCRSAVPWSQDLQHLPKTERQ
jgi:hypothetical protein